MSSGWFAVYHGLFDEEHAQRLGLTGRAVFCTLLHFADLRGDWTNDDFTVFDLSLKELARAAGGKRETIKSILAAHEGFYWIVGASGDRVRPMRVKLLKPKRARGAKIGPPRGDNEGPKSDPLSVESPWKKGAGSGQGGPKSDPRRVRNRTPEGSEIGPTNKRKAAASNELQRSKTRKTSKTRNSYSYGARNRDSHEWRKAERIMAEKDFNAPTVRRVRTSPLSDHELYTILNDAKLGGKGPGWVIQTIRGVIRDKGDRR